MKEKSKRIASLSRPRFWFYLAGPYLIGYVVFANTSDLLSSLFVYSALFFLIPANVFLYGVNDLFDQETDKNNPKKSSREKKLKKTEEHHVKLYILASVFLSFPLLSSNKIAASLTIIFLLLAFFYSASPVRLKARPFLDSASNILYVFPALIGYAQLNAQIFSLKILFFASCWTFAMHLFSAIPDIAFDKKANINTTAVFLGKRRSLMLCTFAWGIVAFGAISYSPIFAPSLIYPLIPLYLLVKNPEHIQKIYWMFPYINTALGAILFFYIIFK